MCPRESRPAPSSHLGRHDTLNSFTRRFLTGSTALALTATMAATVSATSAQAVPSSDPAGSAQQRADNLPNPFAKKQTKLRKQAIELLVNGKAVAEPQRGGGSVVTLANGETAEFPDNKKEARVWTVLSEFGDESSGRYGRGTGPLHNEIAAPDRATDNSTQWTEDFNVAHYEEMFNGEGESFKNYYLDQSNGQYTPTVTTEDWVQVPKNGAWYGDNANETQGYWTYIADTVNAWYEKQLAAKKTPEEIDAYLARFDVWDRYDHDGDKNYNEPDGYIDHFQAIHAGEGEEAGGGTLGEDAIWSHRWYADYTTQGSAGPEGNLLGGKRIGSSNFWIGDYTIEPENGGLGVFAHEYAPRPGPAGLLRHRRRRERFGLLDADVQRLLDGPRRRRHRLRGRHRRHAQRHGPRGEAVPRLAGHAGGGRRRVR